MTRTEARNLRHKIEQAAQHVPDSAAYDVVWMFPRWSETGEFAAGAVVSFDGRLYRCRQAHAAQAGYEPTNTPALWELIPNPNEDGTADNPISYNAGMALEAQKYYTQYDEKYLCTRDTVTPVYNDLRDLVGLYVEVVI